MKIIRLSSVFLGLALGLLQCAGRCAETNDSAEPTASVNAMPSKTHVDKLFGFSIELPAGWETRTEMVIIFVASPPKKKEWYDESVKVAVMNNKPGYDATKLAEAAAKQNGLMWKILSQSDVTINGVKGRQLVLNQTVLGKTARIKKTFLLGKEKYFIISCYAPESEFDKAVPTLDAALASFRILPGV